ncbi:hypothetical protein Ciccas_003907 [Cichlidogyrus casuarinus]|uniref:Uncharacterized protein n=1 Tax=Cichlidogyrus casuarinus TaxID=1844966 RepID=A0ABD2QGD6_9PLAT
MYQSSKTAPCDRSAFKDRLLASICIQQSWLLRILALELTWVSRGACSKAYAQRLTTQLCVNSTQELDDIESFNDDLISTVTIQPKSILVDSMLVKTMNHGLRALLTSNTYKELINAGPIPADSDTAKCFKSDLIGQAMKNCFHKLDVIDCVEFKSTSKGILSLRQVELNSDEAVFNLLTLLLTKQVTANPIELARTSSQALIAWADKFNLHVLLRDSADSVLMAWLQVVSVSSQLMLGTPSMQTLSMPRNSLSNGLELLKQNLQTGLQVLEKIYDFLAAIPVLDAPTSGTLVTLTEACLSLFSACSHIRTAQDHGDFAREELACFIDCLSLITSLIPATQPSKKATANLYASLSHLLRLCSVLDQFVRHSHSDPGKKSGVVAVQCYQVLIRLFFNVEPSLADNSYTPLQCIKNDALNGQPVIVRLTALSLLTHFLELEALCSTTSKRLSKSNRLLHSLASDTDNFVNSLSLSLLEDVEQMDQALGSNGDISVTQFAYQVKMSLFCQIASCEFGAQLLEKSTLVLSLAKCGLFSKISLSALLWEQLADLSRQEQSSTLAKKVLGLLQNSIDHVAHFGSCNMRQVLYFALSCDLNEDCQSSRWELFMNVQLAVMRLFQTLVQNLGMKHDALANQLLCFFKRHQLALLHDPDVNALDKPLSTLLVATRAERQDLSADKTRLLISRFCLALDTVVSHLAAISSSSQLTLHGKSKRRNTSTEPQHQSLSLLPHALAQLPIVLDSVQSCLNLKGSDSSMSRLGNLSLNSIGPCMWSAVEQELSFTQYLNWTGRLLATVHCCMSSEENGMNVEEMDFPFALEFQQPSEAPNSKNCLSTLVSIIRVSLSVLLSVEQKCVRILALIERQLVPFLNELGDCEEEATKNRPGNRAINLVLQTGALTWLLNPQSESESVFTSGQASSLALDELLQLVSTIYGTSSSSWSSDKDSDYKRNEQKMLSKLVTMGCEDLLIRQVEAAKSCLELGLTILWRHLEFSLDLASSKIRSNIWKGLVADQELDRRWLSPELFDELNHASQLGFVSTTDHLFIKAFVKRLERYVNEIKMVRQSNVHSAQEQPTFSVFRGLGRCA